MKGGLAERVDGSMRVWLIYLVLSLSACSLASSFDLHFSVAAETESTAVFPDSFRALGRTASEPNTLSMSLLRQPPPPPTRGYLQITKADTSKTILRDPLVYDPNAANLMYPMTLAAFDTGPEGLTGDSVLTLENPAALQQAPPNTLVYLRRFDAAGAFLESYDLSDPANHTIQWPIAAAAGKYAEADLLVIDKCLAADLAVSGVINLEDFAVLAAAWSAADPAPAADIFLDAKIDLVDLSILAEQWLCFCME